MGVTHGGSGEGSTEPIKIAGNIFVSFIGAGVLGMPFAFEQVRSHSFWRMRQVTGWHCRGHANDDHRWCACNKGHAAAYRVQIRDTGVEEATACACWSREESVML